MATASKKFEMVIASLGVDWDGVSAIAVAVSGGPDSMALCGLLNMWVEKRGGPDIHALIVDHGLRAESAEEAASVAVALEGFSYVSASVLKWDGEKPDAAIQEEARKARYDLMDGYCRNHDIAHLFLGHHRDDQAETVLFRLAKGSGLDGLAGMQAVQSFDENLTVLRPLLEFSKQDLVEFCVDNHVVYVSDPSNENEKFARVRLRQSRAVLEGEGLSAKRVSVTAKRLSRARKALDIVSNSVYKEAILNKNSKRIELNFKILKKQPDEIVLRVLLKALENLRTKADYAPRMEKLEALLDDLISAEAFRKRTLGGVIFERDDANGVLSLSHE